MFTPFQTALISSVQNIQLEEISLYYRSVDFKMSFWCLHFHPKTNENKLFIRFLEETSAWKKDFEFVWPLERTKAETF